MENVKCFFLILSLVLLGCKDDDGTMVVDEESLTTRLQEIIEESDFPGFTVGIARNGNAVYQKSFGFQDIENAVSYKNETIQPLASVSKTFLGVAVVKAIELGYFELETPINNLLAAPIVNPNNPSAVIQVKHLVNHTSGLLDEWDTYLGSYYIFVGEDISSEGALIMQDFGITQRVPKSLSELIDAYYYPGGDYYSSDNFSSSNPGSKENYTNIGSSLMARIIEQVSGQSYEDFLTTHIFNPLEMNSTSFDYGLTNDDYATLYFDKDTPLPLYGLESFPDGALKTSNEDLMKYLLDMIDGQRGESSKLFAQDFYDLLFSETSSTYTVYWDVVPGNGTFGHNGADPGTSTEFYFNGTANAGFFILSNFDSSTDNHDDHREEIIEKINAGIDDFLSN